MLLTTNIFAINPKMEKSQVSIPKTIPDNITIITSAKNRAFEMLKLKYFLIMATISVPPELAPALNIIELPSPGRNMANTSSKSGLSVRGEDSG